MKVVIFAGGLGTRISEESYLKPKPMIEIGEKPMLWHIMKEAQGYRPGEFPNAEYMGHHGLHVGVHQDLETADMAYVLETIERVIAQRSKPA